MTISNQDGRSGPFNGTSSDGGSTGTFTFAYDFKVLDQSHLVVTVTTTSTGAAVTKTITTDYTVTGVGTDSGGNVTFVAGKAPLSTETVTITRAVPLTQLTDLQNRGGVQPSVLEESFDKLTQITQDTKEVQARTLRFPVASTLSGIEMPLTATNDAVIAWSSDGTKLVNGPTSGQISSAESSATAAAASAVTAANEASATAPKYTFSTTTSVADPGTGTVRLNHATASSASIIVLDDQTADTGNPNVEDWLKTFDDSTSTIKGWIRLVEAGTPANYAIYNVTGITDSSGFIQVAVSHVDSNFASGTTFGNSAGLRLFFSRTGDKGDTGSQGIQGIQGDEAGVLPYVFATSTSDADPGAGKLRFNNGTLSSISQIFIDDQSNASGNPDVSALLLTWDDSSNVTDKGTIVVSKKSALQNYFIGRLTSLVDASGYVKLVVTHVTSNGSFSADDDLLVEFQRTGNAGSLDDPMTTRGDIIVRNSSNTTARLAVGSANTVLKSDGTDISWGYTVGTSANNLVQLNGSAALPAVSGANLTNLPIPSGSGVVTATASGSITAGKTVILNANGTVSEVAATAISAALSSSTYTQSGETAAESNDMAYDTTDDVFVWAGRNTISSTNVGRTYALSMNSSLVISEAAPPITLNGSHLGVWSVKYCPAMQRTIVHAQAGSPYAAVVANTVNVVSGVMKASNIVTWSTSNKPYGVTTCFDANELVAGYGTTTSPTSNRIAFVDVSLGSDASGDTFSDFTAEIDVGEGDMSGQSHTYYHQAVHFSVADKWLFGSYKYSTSGYGLGYSVGTVGGSSGGSRTFTSQSSGTIPSSGSYSDAPHSFMNAGDIEYDSTKDRAFVFDNEHLYSLSVGSDGVLKQSSLLEVQSNHTDGSAKKVISIPNSDHLVLFFNDENNSNRISYRVVQFTKGADATADILTLQGSNVEITTQTALSYTPVAYSPDVDGFLIKPYVSSVAQPFIGVRVGRTTTNIKASGTTERFLGVAKSTVSDGQSVEIAVASSVATMASGGMTVGDTQYVQNDGSVGTTNAGYGTAGTAVSATQILLD